MNILFISQCDHRALKESRRILDQFAERRGNRTWQTPITQEGLNTVRRLLRKNARKNTAIACHWIRGLDHSELLWVVGDARRFNADGAVPIRRTARNVLKATEEHDWNTHEDIKLLSTLAALLHDLGKASNAFQNRLNGRVHERNQYRHEWVSLRLFAAFVGKDSDVTWLTRLAQPTSGNDRTWTDRLYRDGIEDGQPFPFVTLEHAPLAQAVAWLILSHHRLPVRPKERDGGIPSFTSAGLTRILLQIDSRWNEVPESQSHETVASYWTFPNGLPVESASWRKEAASICQRLLVLRVRAEGGPKFDWLQNPYVMHLSRLCLMLADHHYSSLTDVKSRLRGYEQGTLYANTSNGQLNQTLEEHLLGVLRDCRFASHALPRFAEHLPSLGKHRRLRQRSGPGNFQWQDSASDLASTMRKESLKQGAFIVNMASTGCGKTMANARIMYSLANQTNGMRCTFAMGLRTLTLQTGSAFRKELHLGEDELAVRVGGGGSTELFKYYETIAESTGSSSRQELLDEDAKVEFIGGNDAAHPLLKRVMHDSKVRALLTAPILVCTIDHLTPATESQRGGRQIAPMLRLMSGDLVLDEPDDFDIDDLPALTRLVHWAGLLGARILLSSATLSPAIVSGLFGAYQSGRRHFAANRQLSDGSGTAPPVCCAWIDEFDVARADCADENTFSLQHDAFTQRRYAELTIRAEKCTRRRAVIVDIPSTSLSSANKISSSFASWLAQSAIRLHGAHHSIDPHSGRRVSFGLVRIANISQLYEVAQELLRQDLSEHFRMYLCVYHSQFPLLMRSAIEYRLDSALNRTMPDAVFELPDVRQRIDAHPERDQLFVVLGSPVTEVGRDHDYDWAVVEPSSMRSIVQLAGRVRRHRPGECIAPNIEIFNRNFRSLRYPGKPAFQWPGFESEEFLLETHVVEQLLRDSELASVDSRPRIVVASSGEFQPKRRLSDLEHMRLEATMLPGQVVSRKRGRPANAHTNIERANAALWWVKRPADALLTGLLPQRQPFRYNPIKSDEFILRVESTRQQDFTLVRRLERRGSRDAAYEPVEKSLLERLPIELELGRNMGLWGGESYLSQLRELARTRRIDLATCAMRYGTVSLPRNDNGWVYHSALGFSKQQ